MAEQKAKLAGRSAYIVTGGQIIPVRIQAVGERQILVKSYSTGAMTQHVKDDVYLSLSRAVSALITWDGKTEYCSVCDYKERCE